MDRFPSSLRHGPHHLGDRDPSCCGLRRVRLAPESRLPAQYEDAVDALMWLGRQAKEGDGEEWMRELVEFSRCYLFGMGNGGNIAFNAGVRATDMDLGLVKINGIIMNQPMFGGVKRTKEELKHETDELMPLPAVDLYWELALPLGTNVDHHYSNPLVEEPHKKKIGLLGRCLVIGFHGDLLIERQQAFVQMLVLKGVQVKARFDNTGFHGVDLVDPRPGAAGLNFIKEFV